MRETIGLHQPRRLPSEEADRIVTSSDERILSLLRDARQQLELERNRRAEPIAIVGMGCRFPGAVQDLASFWRLLREGVDASDEVPADRWDASAFYDPNPDAPGKAYTRRGSFLTHVDEFDAEFFGISPREALAMDPQQRLLLEVVWEALEDAGIIPARLRGSATGVWVGLCLDDYARRTLSSGDARDIDAYNTLGNTRSIAAGRISYVLDLHGPTLQLDTACSSSLVAIHQACQSLRARECDLALVAGVNLMLAPEPTIALCKLRALSADGRCKTFDAAADGYGRGEGCGVVVLERTGDARAAGRRIHALIRGSASNHDGHSNGLTAPSGMAQEAVIRAALANGGVEAASVSYVEAHGTGTLLGDPIEALALQRVYGSERAPSTPLYLGSVKTNFGHLEGAAGVAGLIKVALSLAQGAIPAHLHVREPNPKIPWAELAIQLTSSQLPWPRTDVARRAGVSSFGISGTNAHVVLEEAPVEEASASATVRVAELVVLSARTPAALAQAAGKLREHLLERTDIALGDLAHSLIRTRSLFEHRLCLSVPSRPALLEALAAAATGSAPPGVRASALRAADPLAWLFTGQGAQRLGMGRQLSEQWPAFREALNEVCSWLDPLLELPVREVMWAEPGSPGAALLDQTGYTQPALFAFEWALAALWRSWGVEPELLLGHSIGQLTAAAVAGVFSLESAAQLVAARARLMQALPAGGAMISLTASEEVVREALSDVTEAVSVAAVNAPASVVISGKEADVLGVARRLEAQGVPSKRLSVSHAFHSPLMEPMLEAFQRIAESVSYQPARIPLVSDTTGQLAGPEISTARYWVRHVRDEIRFAAGVQTLAAAGAGAFLELGPRPTLIGLVPACLPDRPALLLSSLRPPRSESEALLAALGDWLTRGGSVDWRGVFPAGGRHVTLPSYAWQRQRYWIEAQARPAPGTRNAAAEPLPFYAVAWQPEELPAAPSARSGRWAVMGFEGQPADPAVVAGLQGAGAQVDVVSLQTLAGSSAEQVLCLWEPASDAASAQLLAERGLAVLQLVSARARPARLWWVTRGAVAVAPNDLVLPAPATLWGLGRSALQERPELRCSLIDHDAQLPLAQLLLRELAGADAETQVAWRSGRRHVARLARAPAASASAGLASAIRMDGTILISGGLGALGLAIAGSFAQRGARHLLLTGRRGLNTPGATEAVAALKHSGARVSVASIDVADRASLARALSELPAAAPLRAVVHAAGIVDDALLSEQTPERLARVFAPKVTGAWNLHELTERHELEAFVLFSSLAGTLGSAGQANYAAANAYLDALAQYRRGRGLPAVSLAWGPWSGSGMAAELEPKARARFARQGIQLISPERGVQLFHAALQQRAPQLVVAPLDLVALAGAWGAAAPPIWRQLLPRPERGSASSVEELPADEALRSAAITRIVREEVARILSLPSAADLSADQPLQELGFDSLMAVELRSALERRLGVPLPAALSFTAATADSLATQLVSQVAGDRRPASARSGIAASPLPLPRQLTRCERLSQLDSGSRLICFPDAGGSAAMYQPFVAMSALGVEVHVISHNRSELADEQRGLQFVRSAAEQVRALADRPYALFGHSLGALFAWSVTRELARSGGEQPLFFAPSALPPWLPQRGTNLNADQLLASVFGSRASAAANLESFQRDYRADLSLWESMPPATPELLAVPIEAFLGASDTLGNRATMTSWAAQTTGDFCLSVLPGDHFYVYEHKVQPLLFEELARAFVDTKLALSRGATPRLQRAREVSFYP
jgi:epothilone polyketide synthase D